MIDSAGFADLRGYLKRRIACARFRVGSTSEDRFWRLQPFPSLFLRHSALRG